MEPDPAEGIGPPAVPRPVTITVANQKGGAGKTTTTINLAAALVERGRKVRIIDGDPQPSSTVWLPPLTAGIGNGLYDLYDGQATLDYVTSETSVPGLYMVPANIKMRDVERRAGIIDTLRDAIRESRAPVDYNLIDTGPSTNYLTLSEMTAADHLIVPLQPTLLDHKGVTDLLKMIDQVQTHFNPAVTVEIFFINRMKHNALVHQDLLEHMTAQHPDAAVMQGPPDTINLQKAVMEHQPITTYEPRGKAAKSYRALAAMLEERIKFNG